jgi:hypothetical protein
MPPTASWPRQAAHTRGRMAGGSEATAQTYKLGSGMVALWNMHYVNTAH